MLQDAGKMGYVLASSTLPDDFPPYLDRSGVNPVLLQQEKLRRAKCCGGLWTVLSTGVVFDGTPVNRPLDLEVKDEKGEWRSAHEFMMLFNITSSLVVADRPGKGRVAGLYGASGINNMYAEYVMLPDTTPMSMGPRALMDDAQRANSASKRDIWAAPTQLTTPKYRALACASLTESINHAGHLWVAIEPPQFGCEPRYTSVGGRKGPTPHVELYAAYHGLLDADLLRGAALRLTKKAHGSAGWDRTRSLLPWNDQAERVMAVVRSIWRQGFGWWCPSLGIVATRALTPEEVHEGYGVNDDWDLIQVGGRCRRRRGAGT
jgi:hypothetical protein